MDLSLLRGRLYTVLEDLSMCLKARGLDQHGSPAAWLEESYLAVVILYVMDICCYVDNVVNELNLPS
jgi:hypothetical protein